MSFPRSYKGICYNCSYVWKFKLKPNELIQMERNRQLLCPNCGSNRVRVFRG